MSHSANMADIAAHYVVAAYILSGELQGTPATLELAEENVKTCKASLERGGYLPEKLETYPHPPETPWPIKIQGNITRIPHEDGSALEVNLKKCQEIFRSTYPDTWR